MRRQGCVQNTTFTTPTSISATKVGRTVKHIRIHAASQLTRGPQHPRQHPTQSLVQNRTAWAYLTLHAACPTTHSNVELRETGTELPGNDQRRRQRQVTQPAGSLEMVDTTTLIAALDRQR